MLKLVKKARNATQGDMSMEWLKPFMTERRYRQGDILFKKGDAATEMFLTVTGKFLVKEIGVSFRLDVSWENLDSLRPITDEPGRSSASKTDKS
jgi:hypothetical protein